MENIAYELHLIFPARFQGSMRIKRGCQYVTMYECTIITSFGIFTVYSKGNTNNNTTFDNKRNTE